MMIPTRRIRSCCRRLLATALVVLLPAGPWALGGEPGASARARSTEPSGWAGAANLEQFLGRALATHPQVVAAEAKVASAEAELRLTRFQVASELIAFWNEWKATERQVARLTQLAKSAAVPQHELIEAKAKLAEIESQLPYLLGQVGGVRAASPAAAVEAGPRRLPEGPEVERILEALNAPTELEFIETPVADVAETLADFHAVHFVVDPTVRELPVSASMRGIPLGAALQAVEVLTPGIRFVVCDYGILVTSDTSPAAATYISANDFWREQQTQQKPSTSGRPGTPPTSHPQATEGATRAPFSADPFAPGPAQPVTPGDPFGPGPAPPATPGDPLAP